MKTILPKLARRIKDEAGQAFILVLILLAVGSLILAPLLSYMGTGLNAGKINEEKLEDFFAADSGIEDGLWQIKGGNLSIKFTSPPYNQYDYDVYGTSYPYPEPLSVNDRDVGVTITNIWIPKGINPAAMGLTKNDLRAIIEGSGTEGEPRLIVTGTVTGADTYEIKIDYYPSSSVYNPAEECRVTDIGIWLPPGFTYVEESSNLEENPLFIYYPSEVYITPHAGGQAIVWHYASPGIMFNALPEVIPAMTPKTAKINFQFTPLGGVPEALSWMVTGGNIDIPFSWDADVRVYEINSVAYKIDEPTEVAIEIEAYAVKSELRNVAGAFAGDYLAIGNSLMARSSPSIRYRDILLTESSTTVDTIPENADVAAAYLYWSGWLEEELELEPIGDAIWQDDCSTFGTWQSIWQDDCSSLGTWQTVFLDDCSTLNNWIPGSDWLLSSGRFSAHPQGSDPDKYLRMKDNRDLSSYSGQTVTISWDQSETGWLESDDYLYFALSNNGGSTWSSNIEAFHDDNPSSPFSYTIPDSYLTSGFRIRFYWNANSTDEYCYIDNIEIKTLLSPNWIAGSHWTIYNNDEFMGWGGGTTADRTLTKAGSIDLSAYQGKMVALFWDQRETGWLESDDYLYFAISGDGGSTWSSNIEAFHDDNPSSPFSYTIPDSYLTSGFKIRFYLEFNSTDEYAYIDDIDIAVFSGDWLPGSHWTIYNNDEFMGQGGGTIAERTLTMVENIDLSAYSGHTLALFWDQRETGYLESDDYLYFALSNDGGSTWSGNIAAFNDDIGSSPQTFNYTIPDEYLTNQFRIRFLWNANSTDEYCYIDDMAIYEVSGAAFADTLAYFEIDGDRVYFDELGEPQEDPTNTEEITADIVQWIDNTSYGQPAGYSYSCKKDVTELVRAFTEEGDDGNYPGNGTYTVGNVYATWDSYDEWAYAGWSLIIIYTSPETTGHQLYLYDDFLYKDHEDPGTPYLDFLDFDQDGEPGGIISSFLVPDPIAGDVIVAKMTCFVGEGDIWYPGDYLRFNGTKLPDNDDILGLGGTNTDNVWNGVSIGMSAEGVDVDTFYVRWDDNLLSPGDTSAEIDIWTDIDIWNLVYIVLSFRSETTTGGTVTYLIH